MKSTTAGAHADYHPDHYRFARTAKVREPFERRKRLSVWPVITPIINLALRISERKIGRGA